MLAINSLYAERESMLLLLSDRCTPCFAIVLSKGQADMNAFTPEAFPF